tara:strand:- start:169 stop:288 length:120 start_codon:yes stop_codon:yes gene_type:complete
VETLNHIITENSTSSIPSGDTIKVYSDLLEDTYYTKGEK